MQTPEVYTMSIAIPSRNNRFKPMTSEMPYWVPNRIQIPPKEYKVKEIPATKECSKCKQTYSSIHFSRRSDRSSGLYCQCKYCNNSIHTKDIQITCSEFHSLIGQRCVYCCTEQATSVDRWDNTKGYTRSNCVPSCVHCNHMKSDLHIKDFIAWIRRFNCEYEPDLDYDENYQLINPPLGVDL